MQVNVKIFAVDVPSALSNGVFYLPEGADIEDVLDQFLELVQINIEEDYFKSSMVLLNGYRSGLATKINDGDTITVLRTLEGG